MAKQKIHLQPIKWVQRIALYVTPSRYYLVGSNNTQTAFKVLKIDRTSNELSIIDDMIEYNYHEIRDLLLRIHHGNFTKSNPTGSVKTLSSFGLIGFVRFLHGYYLILIIRRSKAASIGYHTIYKVDETKLVYIPNQEPRELVREEARCLKAFTSIDLASNFYFSYSYDITHTLQYNLSPIRGGRFFKDPPQQSHSHNNNEDQSHNDSSQQPTSTAEGVLVRNEPFKRFVWNSHLIDIPDVHDDWKTYIIHGFVAQGNICVYGKPIYITLIARRSRFYAGTRFFKRGLNLDGDVANEVETEQIVHDASLSSFSQGYYTSFVQLRGSLPDRWSQEATKIVPKPQILKDFVDPYHEPTAKHFNDLMKRYGTPLVVLNLVKQKERKPQESILSEMISSSVSYLNKFLTQQHQIRLIPFDMARCSKTRNENVMQRLGKIGFNIVRVTGIFQSWRSATKCNHDRTYTMTLRQRTFNRKPSSSRIGGYRLTNGQSLQNGIVRVNCVDSLDRTNTAQFVLGKVALSFQLQALGVLMEPKLEYDTDAVRLLEQLYEDHGDTIALQYGGSQLVHRVKTYRKVSPILTSYSGEIMQTLSRYYSNTFSDSEKQNVINIFLGVRHPNRNNFRQILDNLNTDFYEHNNKLLKPFEMDEGRTRVYRQWWDRELLQSLPRAHNEYEKELTCCAIDIGSGSSFALRVDYFFDSYRPYELTYLDCSFPNLILHTEKDFMPNDCANSSPFCLRLAPGKLRQDYAQVAHKKRLPPNPSVYGLPSTASNLSDLSLMDQSGDERSDAESDMEELSFRRANASSGSLLPSFLRDLSLVVADASLEQQLEIIEGDEALTRTVCDMWVSEQDLQLYNEYVSQKHLVIGFAKHQQQQQKQQQQAPLQRQTKHAPSQQRKGSSASSPSPPLATRNNNNHNSPTIMSIGAYKTDSSAHFSYVEPSESDIKLLSSNCNAEFWYTEPSEKDKLCYDNYVNTVLGWC